MVEKSRVVFISHSHRDHKIADLIKYDLERFGVSAFIAHVDIAPSLEWREEIVKQLEACNLVIALLTTAFQESKWTDQECGIAISKGKPILPLAIELMPYGFLEQFQAQPWEPMNVAQRRGELIRNVTERLAVSPEVIVRTFEKSDSWEDAGIAARLIVDRTDFKPEHVNRIAKAWVENDQINGSFASRPMLDTFFDQHESEMDPSLRSRILKL